MKIKALADRVVVRLDEKPENIDPSGYATGVVVDVGPGREDYFLDLRTHAKERVISISPAQVGDRIVFTAYAASSAGKGFKGPEGIDIVILDNHQILGKIEE